MSAVTPPSVRPAGQSAHARPPPPAPRLQSSPRPPRACRGSRASPPLTAVPWSTVTLVATPFTRLVPVSPPCRLLPRCHPAASTPAALARSPPPAACVRSPPAGRIATSPRLSLRSSFRRRGSLLRRSSRQRASTSAAALALCHRHHHRHAPWGLGRVGTAFPPVQCRQVMTATARLYSQTPHPARPCDCTGR